MFTYFPREAPKPSGPCWCYIACNKCYAGGCATVFEREKENSPIAKCCSPAYVIPVTAALWADDKPDRSAVPDVQCMFFSLPQPMPLRTIADSISHLPFQVRCRQGSWRNCRGDPGTGSRWPTHQGARHFTSTVFLVGDKTPAGRNHHGLACQLIKCSRSRCGLTAEELQTCCCFTVLQCRREQTRSLSSYMAMAYRLMSAGVEVRDFSGHGLVGLPFHFR